MADIIGLVALACIVILLRLTVGSMGIPNYGWLLILSGLSGLSLYLWHRENWPKTSTECLKVAFGTIIVGAVFLTVDAGWAKMMHPDTPFLKAAPQAHGVFGFYFTLLVCPGLTLVALSGAFKAWAIARQNVKLT